MTSQDVKPAARRRKRRSQMFFLSLAGLTLVLFVTVISSAVWRAFRADEYPPTPTIPAHVRPQYAYVSDLRGIVESQPAYSDRFSRLFIGYTVPAGEGNIVRVGEGGWLRLGFVNGITLFLDENTEIELQHIPGQQDTVRETDIQLNNGRILASAGADANQRLVVQVASGVRAVSETGLFGLNYDDLSRQLEIHCFEESCNLQGLEGTPVAVRSGEAVRVWGRRASLSNNVARYEQFAKLGDPGVVPTATPGPYTPAPTTTALAALATSTPTPSATPLPSPTVTVTPTPTPAPRRLGVLPGIPDAISGAAQALSRQWPQQFTWVGEVTDRSEADLVLAVGDGLPLATWIYAVAAPFPTVADAISVTELEEVWTQVGSDLPPLFVDWGTGQTLSALWGSPAENVTFVAQDDLVDSVWAARPARAVVAFEELDARLKVLNLDGTSPLAQDFDAGAYPLSVPVGLLGEPAAVGRMQELWNGPTSNRNPELLTTVAMTGPSGLGRAVGDRMHRKGLTYPGEEVAPVLRRVDIAHLNNEVPFGPDCPVPEPLGDNSFCAPPEYVELMQFVGADVNEMTGNHVNDRGADNLLFTFDLYEEVGIEWFGGGRNLEAAREPLLMEHNGNRIAFVGCNPVGPAQAWAREDYPGALRCEQDFGFLRRQIQELKQQGYFVIATLQYLEHYRTEPTSNQRYYFGLLADAGADAVSGSQGHTPQGFAFQDGTFIHYGLGNLFFDQMDSLRTRQSFIDTYTIYDGRLLSVDLWTGLIEDYSRPRPMTAAERTSLLRQVFSASGW